MHAHIKDSFPIFTHIHNGSSLELQSLCTAARFFPGGEDWITGSLQMRRLDHSFTPGKWITVLLQVRRLDHRFTPGKETGLQVYSREGDWITGSL